MESFDLGRLYFNMVFFKYTVGLFQVLLKIFVELENLILLIFWEFEFDTTYLHIIHVASDFMIIALFLTKKC